MLIKQLKRTTDHSQTIIITLSKQQSVNTAYHYAISGSVSVWGKWMVKGRATK